MTNHTIIISSDTDEAEQFAEFLNTNGHAASIGSDTGNHVDGVHTSTDEGANTIMNQLWSDYSNS